MTDNIIHTLKWKYFSPNVKSRLSDVIKEQSFFDVTLVSEDHKPFLAHRYVLSSFSPVLKNILLKNPYSTTDLSKRCKSPRFGLNPTVYLLWKGLGGPHQYGEFCSGC